MSLLSYTQNGKYMDGVFSKIKKKCSHLTSWISEETTIKFAVYFEQFFIEKKS